MSANENEHPLIRAGKLPDWLNDISIDSQRPVLIPVGEGKNISLSLLMQALDAKVGSTVISLAINPEIAKLFTEFTENPGWSYLPTEPTGVTRVDETTWKVEIGDYSRTLDKEELRQLIVEALEKEPGQ